MKTIQSELIEKGLSDARTSEVDKKCTKAKDKPSERLSDREWTELMGQNRDTFKRVGGRVRKR